MKAREIITDAVATQMTASLNQISPNGDVDFRSVKLAMVSAAEMTATALGTPLDHEECALDGTWTPES